MTAATNETRHGWRLFLIWVVVAVIAEVLFATLVASHVPPGTMTSTAAGAQFDFNVLFYLALPVLLGVWVYLAYATVMWRAGRPGVPEPVGGPSARSNLRVQTTWIAATSTMVMGLFVFGTYELVIPAGAGVFGNRMATGVSSSSAVSSMTSTSAADDGANTVIPGTVSVSAMSSTPWWLGPSSPVMPARSRTKTTG